MQLSARILTALAVLAFTVAIVVGARSATDEVSAATGTVDAMNVGACTTTNSDVLDIGDCKGFNPDTGAEESGGAGNTNAFFEADELGEAIEVEELYATYAHDPKTAAEAPRGIITNGDLIKVSIQDQDRDRRDAVLIAITGAGMDLESDHDGDDTTTVVDVFEDINAGVVDAVPVYRLVSDYADTADTTDGGSLEIVADAVGVDVDDLDDVDLQVPFVKDRTADDTEYATSGTYTLVFDRTEDADKFAPIASKKNRGVVKFFGTVGTGPFKDLKGNVELDEDVVSGGPDTQPAMVVRVSAPSDSPVTIQVIYYQTSDTENLVGGIAYCAKADDTNADNGVDQNGVCEDDGATARDSAADVVYTTDEQSKNSALLVQATSDGNDDDANLFLTETGRFDGIYQGFLRLTDADGDGGDDAINWGENVSDEGNAEDDSAAGAAVLGVGDGPVTITYRDSNDKAQTFVIQIDIEPPTITIESPIHNSRSDDEKPSFIGTINDGDAGLAADTFQLYVDNDPTEGNEFRVLQISQAVSGDDLPIERRLEYTGYGVDFAKYGVIDAGKWMEADDTNVPKEYKSVEADDYSDGSPDGEFADEIEIDFDEADANFDAFNHSIEFQALVRDLAGNVGFSDSDAANPRFINALGQKKVGDRDPDGQKHNVLGVFSRHVVWLDEVDPYIIDDKTATGFFGLDDGKEPVRNRSAVMVVFDNKVNGELIDQGTFSLETDDGSEIAISEVSVVDQLVFLMLDNELASDATPTFSIAEGQEVEDLAGNILSSEEHILNPLDSSDKESSFKVNDGILPVITITLSGGSGTGVGSEGSSKLTNESIDVAIESDETIRGAPKVAVVCSNIKFNEAKSNSDATLVTDADDKTVGYGLSRFQANRTGYDGSDASTAVETNLECGDKPYEKLQSSSLSRPGNNWVYAWRNRTGEGKLADASLTVVVWGHDDSSYEHYKSTSNNPIDAENWGSETAGFKLDSTFNSPLAGDGSGGSVQPQGDDVSEPRPFLLIDFAGEPTTVSVTELTVDGEDALSSLQNTGGNRFLYWPEALDFGEHTVQFDARDAADNEPDVPTKWSFTVTARDPFVLDLAAGWNAVSLPADPVDPALDAVFTQEAIDRVVGWNPLRNPEMPWMIASRIDGVWTTSEEFAPLTDIEARYGYWVHSMEFLTQSVELQGPIDRETGGRPMAKSIPTVAGWNFVGVIDQDGDQTEGNWGHCLQDNETAGMKCDRENPAEGTFTSAGDYMPGFTRAYMWHAIAHGYQVLDKGDPMIIGQGIWVYFGKNALAP